MPAIVQILLVLGIAIVGVLMITSRNPTTLTDEQASKYAKIIRILVPLVLIAGAIKYFVG
ncbi:hypothetical protein [Reinekea sp. G2M2-21]|uniref:hypothetical protein n=1 Tax=Reinekea sp. G2M2-21 TaxID=2788942 RepID=UPI0018A915D2|nr:hypothetical protein [Reinekea sp. G2M2-21]